MNAVVSLFPSITLYRRVLSDYLDISPKPDFRSEPLKKQLKSITLPKTGGHTMGLAMKEKQAVTRETRGEYRKTKKKQRPAPAPLRAGTSYL
jgi:hypothetical protein